MLFTIFALEVELYKRFISALYAINIVFQALFTLAIPIAIFLLFAWLLVSYASWPTWIYVVFIILGVLSGLYSMIKFIISATSALERLEKQREDSHKIKNENLSRKYSDEDFNQKH